MSENNFIEIPENLDRVWVFKYIVQTIYYEDGKSFHDEEYGFCIGKSFVDAVKYLESYYGEELDKICCLEPINSVNPVAKNYEAWKKIAKMLNWDSEYLEPYIG